METIEGGSPPLFHLEDVDDLSARTFQAFVRMLHVHRQAMLRTLAQEHVHFGELFCLKLLARNDGVSQRDLAEMVHLSRPRVTKLLQGLEKMGAITRRADQADQRLTRVFLTEDGRCRERELRALLGGYVNQTIGALSEADRLELERLLNELADRISVKAQGEPEVEPPVSVRAPVALGAGGTGR